MSSIYFAYGRTALKYGLKNLKLTPGSKILIPGYICHVVCDAIKEINLIVTLPLGYNQALNSHLKNGTIKFYEQNYLLRIGNNSWREASWDEVKETTFGNPYPGANGLVVGIDRITY